MSYKFEELTLFHCINIGIGRFRIWGGGGGGGGGEGQDLEFRGAKGGGEQISSRHMTS